MTSRHQRAVGLLLGYVLDLALGDPRRWHPVAGFGRAVAEAEACVWRDSRSRGVCFAASWVALAVAAGLAAERAAGERRQWAVTAAAAWVVLGGATLAREAEAMRRLLMRDDLTGARARLPRLCGRDPHGLDRSQLARAAVESVAENTSDAVVAPLLWGAAAGAPGLLAYRAVNTLDAMIGHRSQRHARFGWAAARLDDLANLAPARATAVLAAVLAPAVGGSSAGALRVLRRDGAAHPSPNAGRCEAAFAGALRCRLGGVNAYGGRVEQRPVLGDGRPPGTTDIALAVRLSRLVGAAAALVAAGVAA